MSLSPSGQITRDFAIDVGLSRVPGYSLIAQLGNNPDIDTAPEDVWTGGGLYPWMTGATSLEAVSSSADDIAAGTGARSIILIGLDINFIEVTQMITLNGVTPVAIPTSLFRINTCTLLSAGSLQTNQGDITIRDSGAGTTRAIIPLGYGTLRQSQYTVPANHSMTFYNVFHSINRPSSTRDVTISAYVRDSSGIYFLVSELTVGPNMVVLPLFATTTLGEKSDFGYRCTATSTTNTDLTSAFFGVLRDNSAL